MRLYPSFGGSRICTTEPYAAFIASMAPKGRPPMNTVSGGGEGSETDINMIWGLFTENWKSEIMVRQLPALIIHM